MRASFGLFAAVLASVQFAAATPPACLLSALGVTTNDPTDMDALCGSLQKSVTGNMTEACSEDLLPKAYSVYSSKCLDEGVTVSKLATGTASATASSSGVASVSASATADATSGSGSGSGTTTGSSSSASASVAEGGATSAEPQRFLYAAAALLATGLTSVILL
ncbi:hypothetical protein F5Y15DRAFT_368364 [Xylariaceae sp. FL0016]|nr:hypothetical protein F5Y15DRAFT_368364 [Xylariaceae sp. FL0016]